MTGNIQAVLFDMDNTLFDFLEAKLIACQRIVEHLGKGDAEAMLQYFLRENTGFEDLENIQDYLLDNKLYSDENYAISCDLYEKVKVEALVLYPGVIETLQKLKEQRLDIALVTDAQSYNAIKRIEKTQIGDYFDAVVTTDMTCAKKPDPKVFHYALNILKIPPSKALFVGDSPRRDIEPARKIGMRTAYAAYGDKRENGQKVEADITLSKISEIIDFIFEK
ncbi:HAD family hydrolase [Methanococcoides sp. SA1]|nr:HAD family hydrolase [Methanococcoides sp. SA1]